MFIRTNICLVPIATTFFRVTVRGTMVNPLGYRVVAYVPCVTTPPCQLLDLVDGSLSEQEAQIILDYIMGATGNIDARDPNWWKEIIYSQ